MTGIAQIRLIDLGPVTVLTRGALIGPPLEHGLTLRQPQVAPVAHQPAKRRQGPGRRAGTRGAAPA